MEETKLIAKKRDLQGSSNVRRMRREGILPGVIYGEGQEAIPVQIDTHEFELVLHHAASETMIVEIDLEGEGVVRALVKDVQHHPVTSDLVHVDLQKVIAGKPIQVEIALELVGEAAGVKAGGILDHTMHAIAVECLPKDLVEAIEIDVSDLEIGSSLSVSDLQLGAEFKVLVDGESIVASVSGPRAEEEEEADEAEVAEGSEPEVITEKKADEEAG